MYRILTEPQTNLIAQQRALLATENLLLEFTDCAIKEIARVASLANRTVENIGARRLHTCIERIIDDISFNACDYKPGDVVRLKHRRWKKLPDKKLAGAEAQTAWQASWAVTLGVVFVGLPWAYYASQDAIRVRAGTTKKKEELQRTVYEKRLDRRREE